MRTNLIARPLLILAALGSVAGIALFSAPALAQMTTPTVPTACSNTHNGTLEPYQSVTSTATSITVTFKNPMPAGFSSTASLDVNICHQKADSTWSNQQLFTAAANPAGTSHTITSATLSAVTIAAERDYWMSFGSSHYGNESIWYYIRTPAASTGPTITIAGGSAVTEGTAASFTVTASAAPSTNLTVNLTVSEAAGSDFVASSNEGADTVTIASGSTTATYTVDTVGDSTDEPNGSVTVAVTASTDYNLGTTTSASVTVNDDDDPVPGAPTVANAIPDQPATVGTAFNYAFPADTFADADGDTLTYTATQSDGTALPAWLTFTAATRTFSGTPTAAGTVNVKVTASDATHSVSDEFTITVAASVTGPTITIEAGPAVTEGTAATFTVRASAAPTAVLPVTVNVSETGGGDFVATANEGTKTVNIAASATTATLTVATVADTTDESMGTVTAQLAAGSNYNVGTASSARVTVHDDDGAGISSVAFTNLPTVSTWGIGGVIEITATFSAAVTVTGTPRFALSPAFGASGTVTRHAGYVSGTGTTALVFRYTVVEGDSAASFGSPIVGVAANALALNGGTIRAGSADADLAHAAASSGKEVYAIRGTIDHAFAFPSPTVDADLDGTAETFTAATGNNEIKVWVGFGKISGNNPLVVDNKGSNANVQVVADIGGTEVTLDYISTDRTEIEFGTHTVVAANADTDGIALKRDGSDNVIRLSNGATVKGSEGNGGNDADLTAAADVGVRAVDVDATPLVRVRGTNAAPTGSDFSKSVRSGQELTFAKGDFGFADGDGDPLMEVRIASLPAASAGELKLDGTAIASADLPKTVTHEELDDGKFIFDVDGSFDGDANFTFKVVDSYGGVSASANNVRVTVTAPVVAGPTTETLVSNLGQSTDGLGTPLSTHDVAQRFTAGSHTTGYRLSSVTLAFDPAPSNLTVKVGTGTAQSIAGKAGTGCDSLASDSCVTLTNPSSLTAGNITFTAPAGTELTKQTNYWVVVEGTGGRSRATISPNQDSGSAAGWSIFNSSANRVATSTGSFSDTGFIRKIAVDGELITAPAAPSAPTVNTVSATELRVTWSPPARDGNSAITDYDLRWRERGSTGNWSEPETDTTDPGPGGRITGLTPEKTYEVQVRAQNAVGASVWSAGTLAATTAECPESHCVTLAHGGGGLHHTLPVPAVAYAVPGPGAGEITLRWAPGEDTREEPRPVVSWSVLRTPIPDDGSATSLPLTLDVRSHTFTGLTPGGAYEMQVRAFARTQGTLVSTPVTGTLRAALHNQIHDAPKIELVRVVSEATEDSDTPKDGEADTYVQGDVILVDVEMTAPVEVTGGNANVTLRLEIGTTDTDVALDSVLNGGRTLRFAHTVVSTDSDTDGFRVTANDDEAVTLGGDPKATVAGEDGGTAAILAWSGLPLEAGARAKVDGSKTTRMGPVPTGATVTDRGRNDCPVNTSWSVCRQRGLLRDAKLEVTFDKALKITNAGYLMRSLEVRSSGTHGGHRNAQQHPSAVSVKGASSPNNKTLVLTLAQPVEQSDTVMLSYFHYDGEKTLRDAANDNPTPAFRDLAVTNDTAGPAPLRADVSGKSLRVVFDGDLDEDSSPAGSAFTVHASDNDFGAREIAGTADAVSVDGSGVFVTLASAVHPNEQASVSYAPPASGAKLQAAATGNAAVSRFERFRVAAVHDTGAPELVDWWLAESGSVSKLTLTFNEPLDAGSVPAPTDFALSDGTPALASDFAFATIAVAGNGVGLTSNKQIANATTGITLAYTPGTNPLQDRQGNAVAKFEETVFERNSSSAPRPSAQKVNGETVTVTMGGNVDPSAVPPISAFTLHYPLASGQTVRQVYPNRVVAVTPMRHTTAPRHRVELLLAHPTAPCDGRTPFTLSYEEPETGPKLQSINGTGSRDWTHLSVTNDLSSNCLRGQANPAVRASKPSSGAHPKSVTLDFGRALNRAKALAAEDFAVEASGASAMSIEGASFTADGAGVELALSRALAAGESATVDYTWPRSGEGLWDAAGNQIDSFSGVRVESEAVAPTAPAFDDGAGKALSTPENHADGAALGTVAATDTDGDALTYSLSGADAAHFEIGDGGAIAVRSGTILDHEMQASYAFTAEVTDGEDADGNAEDPPIADDTIEVTVEVTNVEEPPGAPTGVAAAAASQTGLTVSWTAPVDAGAVPTSTHDLRWFAGDADPADATQWTEVSDTGAATSASISDLSMDTAYRVQVRAVGDGAGPWSESAAGRTEALPALTAQFTGLPAKHDGARLFGFEIEFSEEFDGLKLTALEAGALTVTNGRLVDIKRVTSGQNRRIAVRARPASDDPMTIELAPAVDCAAATAICAADGRALSAAVTATVGGPAQQPAQVPEPELPTVSVSGARADEGQTLSFSVSLSGAATGTVTVDYATSDGTAAAGQDYTSASGTLTFAAGETSKTVSVAALADRVLDDGETLSLTLSNASGAAIGTGTATGTIVDVPPPPPTVSVAGARADEGATLSFAVTLSEAAIGTVTVDYATSDGTATAGQDYTSVSGTLTFAAGETSKTVSVPALADSVLDDGETLSLTLSNASGAAIGTGTATGTIVDVPPPPPTVSVAGARADEGATLSFAVTLSEAAIGTVTVNYATSDGTAAAGQDYTAVSGTLTFSAGETSTTVSVPALTDTSVEDDETFTLTLSNASGATIATGEATGTVIDVPPPLTASFSGLPAEHDGRHLFSFVIVFSENFSGRFPYTTLRDSAVTATNGTVRGAERVVKGENRRWKITVRPSGNGDVTIALAAGSVSTESGRPLSNTVSATVSGPALISVGDVNATEGEDENVVFTVSLNRAAAGTATVNYATADRTAHAGEDYTAVSGTLTFAAGDTSKTVSVPLLDDAIDDDGERFALELSNPTGSALGDRVGLATIENADPMPKAWLARFGRTASMHALEAIGQRVEGGPQESHFTVGGQRLDTLFGSYRTRFGLGAGDGRPADGSPADGSLAGGSPAHGNGSGGIPTDTDSGVGGFAGAGSHGADAAGGAGGWTAPGSPGANPVPPSAGAPSAGAPSAGLPSAGLPSAGQAASLPSAGPSTGHSARQALKQALGLPTFGDGLMGTSFFYSRPANGPADDSLAGGSTADAAPGRFGNWSVWGRTAATRFSGSEDALSIQGEVATATLGVDTEWNRWMTGLVLAMSEGDGTFSQSGASGGTVASTLTSLYPFARYRVNDRTQVWGTLGYGTGDLFVTPGGSDAAIRTDMATTMAAFGGRGVLSVRTGEAGAFELAIRSDAFATETASDRVENLMGATGAASRVRLMLEGTGTMPLSNGAVLSPTLEAGLRFDGGDAETGAGIEIGAGLGFATGRFAVEADVRGLLAHEDAAYEEWGASASVRFQPRSDGLGLNASLGSAWGAANSGVQSLWSTETANGLARGGGFHAAQRLQAEFGYGIQGRKGRALWAPFVAADSGEGQDALRMGLKLTSGPHAEAALELGRRAGQNGLPEHAVQLGGRIRW